MENEIYKLIKKIAYEQTIKRLYDERAEHFEYPFKITKIIFDILDIFNYSYFNTYKECLVENAAIYAIKENDLNYIKLFDKENIDELINSNRVIKAMITQRAFCNINYKIQTNKNNDNEIKSNNKELFEKLNKIYNLETITKKIRKIIISFLRNYDNSEYEYILDMILTTDKLDNELIYYSNFFNINNLKEYKNILYRIILSDNYLYLKSVEKDVLGDVEIADEEQFDEEEFGEEEFDEEDEMLQNIDDDVILILEGKSPLRIDDYEIKMALYRNFIIYNFLLSEQKQDYENIKEDKVAIKTLKKLNPIYFLDFIE